MIEHAADVYNKFHVGADGKTPYGRWKGKPLDKETFEFGELVHYKFAKKAILGKLDDRWSEGIFLGFKWRTGEAMIATEKGVTKAGTIRRTAMNRRWDSEKIGNIRGTPWKLCPDSDKVKEDEG